MEQTIRRKRAKLTIEQVVLALTELKHLSGRELGRRWNVSHATVNNVRSGKNWKAHVALLGLPAYVKQTEGYQKERPAKENLSLQPTQ